MPISNFTLVKIAAIGGIATVSMGLLTRIKIQDNVKATPFYKDALKTVRAHPGAVHLLGEPIKDRSIDISDEAKNFCKDNKARYEVVLRGPKQKGTLYFWATRVSEEAPWFVNRIELEVDKHSDKKLIIKNVESKAI